MSNELNLFGIDKEVPAFLSNAGTGAGNDGVSADDIAVPQLKILQPLSPELMMKIPGAEAGKFFNSVTQDVHDTLHVVNLMYDHNFAVFKTRLTGGGKVFQADTRAEVVEHIDLLPGAAADYEIADTGIHRMLALDATGKPSSPLIIYCSSTQKFTSQQWNTQIQLRCEEFSVPRYATVWELGITSRQNAKGVWYGFNTTFAGLIQDEDLFKRVQDMRTSLEAVDKEWVPQLEQKSS